MPDAIARALLLMRTHPAVAGVSEPSPPGPGGVSIDVGFRLGLPFSWAAEGGSPNGVRAVEEVTLTFPPRYPLNPPRVELRQDFDRSVAHVQPGPPDARPQPCIYDGSLGELLQQQGLAGILNQTLVWLENAALGTLIDPEQGWEPVRRDALDDAIVADAEHLRSLVTSKGGYALFRFDYWRFRAGKGAGHSSYYGELGRERIQLNPRAVVDFFAERTLRSDGAWGRSLGVVAWPGRLPSGEPVVADRYRPETVTEWATLSERAAEYGCAAPLRDAANWLRTCVQGYETVGTFPLAVVLCARRPCKLIGEASDIELCPYVVEIGAPKLLGAGDATGVRSAGHRHVITVPLLRRMADDDASVEAPRWTLLGCGSLGSKIALHLARAGRAPDRVLDSRTFGPHNAARHALTPAADRMQGSWLGAKADALAEAIGGLGQKAEAIVADAADAARDPALARRVFPAGTWAAVNATASLQVREALASVPTGIDLPRVIEASLFGDGTVGLLATEGPGRNPNTGDLIGEAYDHLRRDPDLRAAVFSGGSALQRRAVGEGCGSATMAVPDARISMLAAPMAEAIRAMQREGLPVGGGRILIGAVGEDGLSVVWQRLDVGPVEVVAAAGSDPGSGYEVRVSARAHAAIEAEVARWPGTETGGVLVGRFSEAARAFYVVDVVGAPEDSRRSASEFALGTAGLRGALASYSQNCGHSLYCLGTWHSHLSASGPSALDRATARTVALARLLPSILLISTPGGYRALLADAAT